MWPDVSDSVAAVIRGHGMFEESAEKKVNGSLAWEHRPHTSAQVKSKGQ